MGRASQSVLFPDNQCLFCNKNTIKINQVKHSLVTCSTETAESSIKQAALDKDDEEILRKVRDQEFRAREVRYHNCCQRDNHPYKGQTL